MLIGITGGIGSGKSTVAQELATMGYPVYSTDSEAKRIIVSNPMVRSQIELLFGSDVYDGDVYLTEKVSKKVFRHPDLLAKLNEIVHPAVAYDLRQWKKKQEQDGQTTCFMESAILFESGLESICDYVVAITAPESVRLERTLLRDYHGSHSQTHIAAVQARMQAQMTDEERTRRANLALSNDGSTPIHTLATQLLRQCTPHATPLNEE